VETIIGDRERDLDKLKGRIWEAVIDTSGYFPRLVRLSAESLAASVSRYVFISSLSVYESFKKIGMDESDPVGKIENETTEEITGETYGPLKALCEQAVQDIFGLERTLIARPGLIVGPRDPTGRFTYWPHRAARGGEILAPGPPERVTQVVDVRDLAEWIVALCERDRGGTFNAIHPGTSFGELLDSCLRVTQSGGRVTWVTDEFLLEYEVEEWMELPLWLADPALAAADRVDVRRALAAGLSFRSLDETVRDTLEHAETVAGVGLAPEREAELLEAWRGR
jgi:2'-hydroxyisoflavone reductase